MKTPIFSVAFSACFLLATTLWLAAPGQAAAPDDTPAAAQFYRLVAP